jgi:glutathione-regulated potassium-efflux system ancillary protein KefC
LTQALVIIIALIAGLAAKRIALPPLVGFLIAGFVVAQVPALASIDFQPLADLGVTLLLFTIGLKLDLRSLLRPHIWGVTTVHMAITIILISLLVLALKTSGWLYLSQLGLEQFLTIGFALSFSSTVFAVKVLEERGEMASLHGRIAIGILVMQDIFAVTYLAVSSGQIPSLWAPLLLLAIPARPLLNYLLKRCGHGELLILAGFSLALLGAMLFELVNIKGDLGALYMGAVLATLPKSHELSKTLLHFKDVLLVGFFLSIGQYGIPSTDAWLLALMFGLVLVFKPLLYISLLSGFKLRARTAWLTGLTLNHYSEFGLIVMAMAVSTHVLQPKWLVVMALALSISFVIASIINGQNSRLFKRFRPTLLSMERNARLSEQKPIDIGNAKVLILGMGRVGAGAYTELCESYGNVIAGIEQSEFKAKTLRKEGKHIVVGDASDRELWERICENEVELAILALSNQQETLSVISILKESGFTGTIAAVAKYDDEVLELQRQGVISFNFYAEAGAGFAEHVLETIKPKADIKNTTS